MKTNSRKQKSRLKKKFALIPFQSCETVKIISKDGSAISTDFEGLKNKGKNILHSFKCVKGRAEIIFEDGTKEIVNIDVRKKFLVRIGATLLSLGVLFGAYKILLEDNSKNQSDDVPSPTPSASFDVPVEASPSQPEPTTAPSPDNNPVIAPSPTPDKQVNNEETPIPANSDDKKDGKKDNKPANPELGTPESEETPDVTPSEEASPEVSEQPTEEPSETPTEAPTEAPTETPTETPEVIPEEPFIPEEPSIPPIKPTDPVIPNPPLVDEGGDSDDDIDFDSPEPPLVDEDGDKDDDIIFDPPLVDGDGDKDDDIIFDSIDSQISDTLYNISYPKLILKYTQKK